MIRSHLITLAATAVGTPEPAACGHVVGSLFTQEAPMPVHRESERRKKGIKRGKGGRITKKSKPKPKKR